MVLLRQLRLSLRGEPAAFVGSARCCGRRHVTVCRGLAAAAAAPARPEPEPEPRPSGEATQTMVDGSWAPPDLLHVDRTLMPAGVFSRGFALLLDSLIAGGASAVVGELAMANGYADGLGGFVASFGAMMLVRDQLPGQFPSIGKQRLGLELVAPIRPVRARNTAGKSGLRLLCMYSMCSM
jgi:hypothetical protein